MSVIWWLLDRRWRRRLRQSTTPLHASFLRKTSFFELREELQLRALRLSVARALISPKSFMIAGTEIVSTRSDVDPWCQKRCALDRRRLQKLSRCHIQHARRRHSSHEDPVARHESKPSCRLVVNHTSRHAACKTHMAQFCGPLLSVPLSASGLLTESGARYAAGLYVWLQRAGTPLAMNLVRPSQCFPRTFRQTSSRVTLALSEPVGCAAVSDQSVSSWCAGHGSDKKGKTSTEVRFLRDTSSAPQRPRNSLRGWSLTRRCLVHRHRSFSPVSGQQLVDFLIFKSHLDFTHTADAQNIFCRQRPQ